MQKYEHRGLSINGKSFSALVADSFSKRMIGLMFRKKLNKRECMLFIFGSEGDQAIWMRNMLFPIDVVWLDSKMRVVDTVQSIKPCKSILSCKEYHPRRAAKYIIEMVSGSVKANGINSRSRISVQ